MDWRDVSVVERKVSTEEVVVEVCCRCALICLHLVFSAAK